MRLNWRFWEIKEPEYLEQCSKKQLLDRIKKFFDRFQSEVPDEILLYNRPFEEYKRWLIQPFLMKKCVCGELAEYFVSLKDGRKLNVCYECYKKYGDIID